MLKLVIGNKNLSSWSLRPWLLLRQCNLPFEEIGLRLDTPEFQAQIGQYTPARRVPVLIDGATTVWDSLAICEYVNELVKGAAWPSDRAARAHARAVSAEMHSGFSALRHTWSLRAAEKVKVEATPATLLDVQRIDAIWQDCRQRYRGPWLFGPSFTIADAMYAPVVLRFNTYGPKLSSSAETYVQQALGDRHLHAWIQAAAQEIGMRGA
ncbi:MAG: glutathione S-transferase family protein [Steroidobacteraceae bacterium]